MWDLGVDHPRIQHSRKMNVSGVLAATGYFLRSIPPWRRLADKREFGIWRQRRRLIDWDLSFFLSQTVLRDSEDETFSSRLGCLRRGWGLLILVLGLACGFCFALDTLSDGLVLIRRLLLLRLLFPCTHHGFRRHGHPSFAGFRSSSRAFASPCLAASSVAANTLG